MCVFRHNHSSDRGECDLSPPSINPPFLSPSTLDLTSTWPPASLYRSLLAPRVLPFLSRCFISPPSVAAPPFVHPSVHPSLSLFFFFYPSPDLNTRLSDVDPLSPFIFHHFIRFIYCAPPLFLFWRGDVWLRGWGDEETKEVKERRAQKGDY